jgi:hypothetical protein
MKWLTCCNIELTDLLKLWADLLQLCSGWPATTSWVAAQLWARWPDLSVSWLTCWNYGLVQYAYGSCCIYGLDDLHLWAGWPTLTMTWLSATSMCCLTCCNYELTEILQPVLRIWIRVRIHRIHMFLGFPDPDPLVRGMDLDLDPALDPDPFIIMQK